MKTFDIQLNHADKPFTLDAAKLVEGRCLIQGASGSGKSYLVRVMAEQTISGGLQTIILDPEGEFVTLREKCKVLIAGRGGDVPTETRSAKLLARRIAETGVSAVVDLSDLALDDRRQFVRIFLETLDALPKHLEAPRLVVLDEAHRFCPESGKGSATSTEAVITLMSQGRKRGLAGVLVTQRLSKLKKDAAAEAGNIFIGRTSPIDLVSAQDVLGVTKVERDILRKLGAGYFLVTGPALSDLAPTLLKIRKSQTTHPKPGARHMAKMPPPQRAITKILKEFESLPPAQEVEDAQNLKDAQAEIRRLTKELGLARAGDTQRWQNASQALALQKRLEKAEAAVDEALEAGIERERNRLTRPLQKLPKALRAVAQKPMAQALTALEDAAVAVEMLLAEPESRAGRPKPVAMHEGEPVGMRTTVFPVAPTWRSMPFSWSGAPGKILTVLIQWHPESLEQRRVAALAGVHWKSSTFRNALTKLRNANVVQSEGKQMWATEEAHATYSGGVKPLPSGAALISGWKARLGGVPLAIFEALLRHEGCGDRETICSEAGADPTKSTARNAFTKLRNLGLLENGSGDLKLTEHVVEAMS